MNALYFILICVFWGGSYLGISISLKGFSPFLAATLRVFVALLMSAAYLVLQKQKLPEKKYIFQIVMNGLIGIGFPWIFLFWGELHVQPALAAIIIATSPIFTVLSLAIIFGTKVEPLSWSKWFGVALGMGGIVVIFGPAVSGGSLDNFWGAFAIVGTAICYGISIAWLKKLTPFASNMMMLFLECIGALIILIPATITYGVFRYYLTGEHLLAASLAIAYLSVFSTFLAFIFFYRLVHNLGGVHAAATTYLVPVISIFIDWAVLGKWVGNHAFFGTLVIFTALRLIHKSTPPAIE